MKMLFTNPTYMLLAFALGAGVGLFNTFATQMEQFTCARGYDDSFSGLAVTLMLVAGFIGSVIVGFIVAKTGKLIEVMKICGGIACIAGLLIEQFLRKASLEGAILASTSM